MKIPSSSAALLGVASLVCFGCNNDPCDISVVSRDLGGPGLMDCGVAAAVGASANQCAVDALRQDHTFRVFTEAADGELEGIVHAAGGEFFAQRTRGARVEQAACGGAEVVGASGAQRVECTGAGDYEVVCE